MTNNANPFESMRKQLRMRALADKLQPYAEQLEEIYQAAKEANVEDMYFAAVPPITLAEDPFNPTQPVPLRWYIREYDGKSFCLVFFPDGDHPLTKRMAPKIEVEPDQWMDNMAIWWND